MKPWLILQTALIKLVALWVVFGLGYPFLGWLLFFSGGGIVFMHMIQPRWQGLFAVKARFETERKEVWLTIDDGPCPVDTPRILDLLDKYEARATFFMIGERAAANSELVREVLDRGHEVGNHSLTHPVATFWAAGLRRTRREVLGCLDILKAQGASVHWYRSPVGIKNFWLKRVLRDSGLRCVAWSIRSGDALGQSSDAVVKRVLRELHPGAIILMHEGAALSPSVRLHALEGVLQGFKEHGYRCVVPMRDTGLCQAKLIER